MDMHVYVILTIFFCAEVIFGLDKNKCHVASGENGIKVQRCCVNNFFNHTAKECQECPPGYIGTDCKQKCQNGYFGIACREKCDCKDTERCHHMSGCVKITTTEETTTANEYSTITASTSSYHLVSTDSTSEVEKEEFKFSAVYLLICGALILLVLMALLYKYRLDKCSSHKTLSPSERVQNHDINLPIPTARVGPLRPYYEEADEEVYWDIRESLMIENFSRPPTRLLPNERRLASRLNKVSILKDSMYNHLNYKGSLPNVCVANEYSSVLDSRPYKVCRFNKSEHCLVEAGKIATFSSLQNIHEKDASDYREVWQDESKSISHM